MQQEMGYIFEVFREGSFSKAAQKLYLSQPALSSAVKRVEERIGMKLFDRNSQPLVLTEAGEIYIRKIREIKMLEDDLDAQLRDLSELKCGHIRIGGTQYFNSYVLPLVLKHFAETYPDVHIDLYEVGSPELESRLQDGRIDLIFNCKDTDPNLFSFQEVFRDYILLAVPSEYPVNRLLEGTGLTKHMVEENAYRLPDCPCAALEAFSEIPFVLLKEGNNLYERAMKLCDMAGFIPHQKMQVEQMVTAYHLAAHGLGATFVSARLVKKSVARDMLYYKLDSPLTIRKFKAITLKDRYIPHAVQVFMGMIEELYRDASDTPLQSGMHR